MHRVNDPLSPAHPLFFSSLHWPLRSGESHFISQRLCREQQQEPSRRQREGTVWIAPPPHALSLTSVTTLHTLFYFLSVGCSHSLSFSNSHIQFTIYVSLSLLEKCLQSPASGAQQHICAGILLLSVFSAFFHQTRIAILHRLSAFLLPTLPLSALERVATRQTQQVGVDLGERVCEWV